MRRRRSTSVLGIAAMAIAVMACSNGGGGGTTAASQAPTIAVSSAAAVEPSPSAARDFLKNVDIGGRTLSIACVGPTDTGRPTVIFEAGLGTDKGIWSGALSGLQTTERGCSYDRAGLGMSKPGPTPQTTYGQVDDLHKLLAAAGIKPPYVLVGHSSGGWNVMVYAGRYPKEVAGVVMVDVRPPLASELFRKALPPVSVSEPEGVHQTRADLTEWEFDPTQNPEGLDLIKSASQAAASPGFGDDPLVVLVAGDRSAVTEGLPPSLATSFDRIWMDLEAKLAKLSSKGKEQIVDGVTHDLPDEQPDVVVNAIHEVLGTAAG
jgi:pimeloyl-ACP methyl ester carboxylesterase